VDGPSLQQVIDELRGGFPIPAAATIMRGVLQALVAAHANGMIHRDIKPANILLGHPREKIASITEQAVKVTDFGLGQVGGATAQSIMQSGSLLTEDGRSISGTLAYMSPEQKEGKEIDARSDLYSCGLVLYEMLTGERPQGTDLPSAMRSGVPAALDDVFRRSYARLDRRFASAAEMLAALSVDAPAPPPPPKARRTVDGVAVCPNCGTATQQDDQFCIGCGRQLAASVPRCPACGGYVHRADRFCIFCGKDLGVLA
jgi:serine/threonine protein kinase